MKRLSLICLAAPLGLAACAETPMGPSISVLPPPGKPFETFQQEQQYCQAAAAQAVQGQAEHENNRAIIGGVLSTALGAGLGAAIGGGYGAGIGAASGASLGAAGGAGYSDAHQNPIQAQYDNQYAACMVSRGNVIPGATGVSIPMYPGYTAPPAQIAPAPSPAPAAPAYPRY